MSVQTSDDRLPKLLFSMITAGHCDSEEAMKVWAEINPLLQSSPYSGLITGIICRAYEVLGIQSLQTLPMLVSAMTEEVSPFVQVYVEGALEAAEVERAAQAKKKPEDFSSFMSMLSAAPTATPTAAPVKAPVALTAPVAAPLVAPTPKKVSAPTTAPHVPSAATITPKVRSPGRPRKEVKLEDLDYGERCRRLGEVVETTDASLAHLPPRPIHPPVPINESITPEHLICLEDGRPYTMLARSLQSRYKMTPEQYRRRWGLPDDYPMVSPNYSLTKREGALKHGLGQKRGKRN